MSVMTVTTRITRQYLERKTKSDLAQMYLDLLDNRDADYLAGVEIGVRCHEKGMNLQAALAFAKNPNPERQP